MIYGKYIISLKFTNSFYENRVSKEDGICRETSSVFTYLPSSLSTDTYYFYSDMFSFMMKIRVNGVSFFLLSYSNL